MSFSPAIADAILMRIADGESLRTICKDEGMPSRQTVLRWLWGESSEAIEYGFVAKYARAREAQGDAMDDRILDVADHVTSESAAADRVRLAALQWRAAKLRPKVYGEKVAIGGAPDLGPVNMNLTNLSEEQLAQLERTISHLAGAAGGDAEGDQGGEGAAGG